MYNVSFEVLLNIAPTSFAYITSLSHSPFFLTETVMGLHPTPNKVIEHMLFFFSVAFSKNIVQQSS